MNSYVWDARNRLASADNNGAVFSYDPLGRRVSKTVLSTTTNFLYDGANAVQEFGTLPTANLLTGGVDERFTRTTAAETDNYLTDALGSTVTLTDAAGNSVAQYSYAPFGSLSASGATTTNSYTYTGRESDGLGINYYRARYYNPAQEGSSARTRRARHLSGYSSWQFGKHFATTFSRIYYAADLELPFFAFCRWINRRCFRLLGRYGRNAIW
jgi:YD repeat-containing protein